jgi:ABC-type proline/glycine betaine transport system permease subunit
MKSGSFFNFFMNKKGEIFSLTIKHLQLSVLAVIIASPSAKTVTSPS